MTLPGFEHLTTDLNPEQLEAVTHHGSPLLIIAGAGTGKTRVITHRIAYLVQAIGIPHQQILAVTFTNKAAREMRERSCRLLNRPNDPTLPISTFHSRCARILREEAEAARIDRSFAILDEKDQLSAVKIAMEDLGVPDKKVRPGQVQHFINLAKMKLLSVEDCREEFAGDDVPYGELYAQYEKVLEKSSSLDFEDLIFRTVVLFRDNEEARLRWRDRYRYVLVDEFQDTNHSQYELVKLLTGERREICVVGDEDQSIYSWRGADVNNLLDFQKDFEGAKLVRLEQNYRSVANVLRAASGVISHNRMRIGKTLRTEKDEGPLLEAISGYDEGDEMERVADSIGRLLAMPGVSAEEVAVFYRSHRLSRGMEDALRMQGIPYRVVGGIRFYDRAEVKDVLSYLRLATNPMNDLAFLRVVNVPTRGVGKKTLGDLTAHAGLRGCSLYEATHQLLNDEAIKGKARTGLKEFLEAVDRWHESAKTAPASEVMKQVMEDTRYKEEGVGDPKSFDGRTRLDNLEELESVVEVFEQEQASHSLSDFLEEMALDAQRNEEDTRPKVSLMTVHNAKGLEFDYVYLIALEQGVFPNALTFEHPDQFEEERRLFYVGLTRARERVTVSRAGRRMRQGYYENTEPSVFLRELPEEVMDEDARRRLGISVTVSPYGEAVENGLSHQNRQYGAQFAGKSHPGWRRPSAPPSTVRRGGKSFDVGDRVTHPVMGEGTVSEKGGRRGSERIRVDFDDGRDQEFVVKFAPLKKVE